MDYCRLAARRALHCMLLLVAASGAVAQATRIAASDQALRDVERVRILEGEMRSEQSLAETASKRKAERLAVRDLPGADEAEQSLQRSLANMAALRREIELARGSAARPAAPAPAPRTVSAGRVPQVTLAWWDVYARDPRGITSTVVPRSLAPAQQ